MSPNYQLIYYVATLILIPKKFNIRKLWKYDVVLIWLHAYNIVINWDNEVFQHMWDYRRKENTWVSYGDLITRVWMHVDFDLYERDSIES